MSSSWSRRTIGALAAVAALGVVTACGSAQSPGARPESPEPAISAHPARVDPATLELPLDSYRPSDDEATLLASADDALFDRCMGRFGFHPLPAAAPSPPPAVTMGVNERRYGLTDPASAAARGYHLPPGLEEVEEPEHFSKVEQQIAIGARQGSYRGHRVPLGGCGGEADRALAAGTTKPTDPHLAENLSVASLDQAQRDSRVRAGFSDWSVCMKRAGYHYASPWDANNDKAFQTVHPSVREIATARADVRCKKQVHLVATWAAVEAAYQRRAIAHNAGQLAIVRDQLHAMVANARHLRIP